MYTFILHILLYLLKNYILLLVYKTNQQCNLLSQPSLYKVASLRCLQHTLLYTSPLYYIHLLNTESTNILYYITFTSSTQEAPTYFTIYLTSILHPLAQCCKRRHILPYTWPLYYIHLLNTGSTNILYYILDLYITSTCSML